MLVGVVATLASGGLVAVSGMEATMASTRSEMSALLNIRSEAARIRGIDRLMLLYFPDIAYFDLAPGFQYPGSAALRGRFLAWFAAYNGPIGMEIRDLHILTSGDIAVASMLNRTSGTLKNGRAVGYWVRATVCCQRSNYRRLIPHEHISLPVDFASGRAAIDLVP